MSRVRRILWGVLTAAGAASGAHAQSGVFSPDTLHGFVDLRLTAAGGERSWLDGGFGKTSVKGDRVDLELAAAALEWKPRFGFSWSGHVTAEIQPQVDPAVDIGEAFLSYRAPPNGAGRITARAGLFYPPVSLEHQGVAWSNPDMLSASAINSWIGEEVKVIGLEGAIERAFGGHTLKATGAVFGWNDTSGTLLTFRGWALHGVKGNARTAFDLPPLSAFMRTKQAPVTDPIFELDDRAGYYGRLEWRPPAPVIVDATYYDNVGNRIGVQDKQWAWETRFLNLGVRWQPTDRIKVMAQAMNGETIMGHRPPGGRWVEAGFHSAYLLASRQAGAHTLSGRIDWFEVNDRTHRIIDNNDEEGWAVAAAWRRRLNDHADLLVEALHVESDRPSRALAGLAADQSQTTFQTALRLGF